MNDQQPAPGPQVREASSGEIVPAPIPLGELPLVRQVVGLAASNSRALGGDTAATFLTGVLLQLQHDLSNSRAKEDKAVSHQVENAALKAEIKFERENRNLRNLAITAGAVLLSQAADMAGKGSEAATISIVAVTGAALWLLGMFGARGSKS